VFASIHESTRDSLLLACFGVWPRQLRCGPAANPQLAGDWQPCQTTRRGSMNFSRSTVLFASTMAAFFASAPAPAQETQSKAWVQVESIDIYDTDKGPGSDGSYRFYRNDQQLRGLTTVDEDSWSNPDYALYRQTVVFSVLPSLPMTSDSVVTGTGSGYGIVDGTYTEAGAELKALNRVAIGYGGVATTGTESFEPGFWNLILGAHTGVVIDAHSFAEVSLRDRCELTCGESYAAAALFAQFGPESVSDPGLPDPDQLITLEDANSVFLGEADITGSGGLLHVSVTQDLHLVFENLSDQEVMGRIRWDTDVYGISAVPEPATFALVLAGLAGVAMSTRRNRSV
jgi:hypothetical protein